MTVLRRGGDLYDHGDVLAMVGADGRMRAVAPGLVPYVLSSRVSFFVHRKNSDMGELRRVEPTNIPGRSQPMTLKSRPCGYSLPLARSSQR